jgi:predicted CopG family antitoxin
MNQKTISLPEDIYLVLKKLKRKEESFADLIARLIQEKQTKENNLEKLAGSLKEDNEWDQILEDIYEDRKKPARLNEE